MEASIQKSLGQEHNVLVLIRSTRYFEFLNSPTSAMPDKMGRRNRLASANKIAKKKVTLPSQKFLFLLLQFLKSLDIFSYLSPILIRISLYKHQSIFINILFNMSINGLIPILIP